jgi:hypothetical protein
MQTKFHVRPINSVIFLSDLNFSGYVPEFSDGEIVVGNKDIILVGTMSEVDGSTTVTVIESGEANFREFEYIFPLKLPTCRFCISDSMRKVFFEKMTKESLVMVGININDYSEPNEITILIVT